MTRSGVAIRVVIVDDSALVRQLLTRMLEAAPDIHVVGTAADPLIARNKIKQLNPDVITLDVEMPRMDGLTFLSNLMRLRPMPVVMVSSLTQHGAEVTLQALELGAVDFFPKPQTDLAAMFEQYAEEIQDKVRVAARSRVRTAALSDAGGARRASAPVRSFRGSHNVIAIGASTGGTEAIREVLMEFPADAPPVVVAQHIPAAFSGPFAERVNGLAAMSVREAVDGERLLDGHVYVAPGGLHLRVERTGAHWICRVTDDDPVNRHRPSVDVLFESVAQSAGPAAVGALLTGMGEDGARGLLAMLRAGATTVAQDEQTSVVWGMPGTAVRLGAAQSVLPLGAIASAILENVAEPRSSAS